jgi:GNAT superfamily N-acetyltransferase
VTTPSPGDRVVIRFRKGPGAPADWRADDSATLSDVTGILQAGDPSALVVRRGDDVVHVPTALVQAVKVLSDKPVRNSEIRSLEVAAARGWPGLEWTMINGWRARAGGGFSRRANSAVPLEMGARVDDDTVTRLQAWYDDRGLPLKLAVVTRLIPVSHVPAADYVITVEALTAPIGVLATSSAEPVEISAQPSEHWAATYCAEHGDRDVALAASVVSAVDGGKLAFAGIRNSDGELVAIGRGSVTEGLDGHRWLGLSALWTSPGHRGQGLGRSVLTALEQWGAADGASSIYLQVETGNSTAREWYRRLGFGLHHSYGYIDY